MKYRVTCAAYDVTKTPPAVVLMNTGEALSTEIIDTETNVLFQHCEDVWDVEDRMLEFWNRLNEHDQDPPHYTHNPKEKVVVVDVRPEEET